MDNFQTFESVIRQLAAKPITAVHFSHKLVRVIFSDGFECAMKWDLSLRLFLITLQGVHVQRQNVTPDCIWCPLGYFLMLGWSPGECVSFQRGHLKMVIGFS